MNRSGFCSASLMWLLAVILDRMSINRIAATLGVTWHTVNEVVLASGREMLLADPSRGHDHGPLPRCFPGRRGVRPLPTTSAARHLEVIGAPRLSPGSVRPCAQERHYSPSVNTIGCTLARRASGILAYFDHPAPATAQPRPSTADSNNSEAPHQASET